MALIKVNNRGQSADFTTENYGRRNYIVNGGFQVWQRGATLSSLVNSWGPDRFFNTNTSMTWTRTANTFDAPTPYMCVLTGGGSDSRFRFSFELPSSTVQKPFEIGSYWTLSMYTDLDISGRTMNITYANNPNDTPVNASPNATWVSLGSNRYSLTVQINASNTSNKVGMRFSGPFTGPVGEGVNSISVTGVQFERGQEATPFEERSYGEELALCQRYYEQGNLSQRQSGSIIRIGQSYQTTKRVNASVNVYYDNNKAAAGTINVSNTTNSGWNEGGSLNFWNMEKNVGGNPDSIDYNCFWTASAEL